MAFRPISRTQQRNKIRYVLAIKQNVMAEEIREFSAISLNSGAEGKCDSDYRIIRDSGG